MASNKHMYCPYADAKDIPTALQVIHDYKMTGQLGNKTILITGCSSGIGVETARALYATGAKLFLTARDMPKLQAIIDDIVTSSEHGTKPEAMELHLDSLTSVRKVAAEIIEKSGGKLNILINNAGVAGVPYEVTEDGFERTLGTNHLAHFLLFQLLKPTLIESAKSSGTTSRVINLTSEAHKMLPKMSFDDMHWRTDPSTYNKWVAYARSKAACIMMANAITRYYGAEGITGLTVHPGLIATQLNRYVTKEDYDMIGGKAFVDKFRKSPEQGAATTVWAVVEPRYEDVANGSKYLVKVGEGWPKTEKEAIDAPTFAPYVFDDDAEDELWRIGCEEVGVPVDSPS